MAAPSSTASAQFSSRPARIISDTASSSSSASKNSATSAYELNQVTAQIPSGDVSDDAFAIVTKETPEILKQWEGVVTAVEERSFFAMARLVDSDHERADEELEIEYDGNVLPSERSLVKEGAVFYLTIEKHNPPGERPYKVTRLIFRRMPRWSARDIERADKVADDLWQKLNAKRD